MKTGRPVMERIRHIILVFNEKQITTVGSISEVSLAELATISTEDVMPHARLLAGLCPARTCRCWVLLISSLADSNT